MYIYISYDRKSSHIYYFSTEEERFISRGRSRGIFYNWRTMIIGVIAYAIVELARIFDYLQYQLEMMGIQKNSLFTIMAIVMIFASVVKMAGEYFALKTSYRIDKGNFTVPESYYKNIALKRILFVLNILVVTMSPFFISTFVKEGMSLFSIAIWGLFLDSLLHKILFNNPFRHLIY